jgi:nucleoside phosphorylase
MLPTVATHRSPVDIGILAVIPPELDAAKDALGILPTDRQLKQSANDTVYWRGAGRSALRGRDYSLVLAGIGAAGTSSAAALASQLVERYRPRVVLLVGIAAGMRGKVRIGDVVLSERVVAYEPAAVAVGKNGKRVVEPRPEIARVNHGLLQDAINYRPDPARLAAVFQRIQGAFPAAPRGKKKEWQEHVAAALTCRALATIASG